MPDIPNSRIRAARAASLTAWLTSLTAMSLLWTHAACALNRDARLVDLLHTGWSARDGAPVGGVKQLAQTSDGFLWMASNVGSGLYRFDGHFEHIDLPRNDRLRSMIVYSLFAPKSGGLWIGFTFGGAAFLKDGHLIVYNEQDGLPPGSVKDFAQDSDGSLWAATTHGLAHFGPAGWRSVASLDSASSDPEGIFIDSQGTLWLACAGKVLFLPKGATVLQELPEHVDSPSVAESASGIIWLGDRQGIRPIRKIDNPAARAVYSTQRMLIDRDGGIWGAHAPRGVLRIARLPTTPGPQLIRWTELFGGEDHETSNLNRFSALEDREGNVWIGTSAGLDRFSNQNLVREFDSPEPQTGIAAADNGGVWVGSPANRSSIWSLEGGALIPRTPAYAISCLLRTADGSVWFGGSAGLWRYAKGWSERIPAPPVAEGQQVQAMAADRAGALWVSFVRRGVFRWLGSHWSEYGDLPALPKLTAVTLATDSSGRVWFGYADETIAVLDGSSVRLFSARDGLAVGSVTAIYAGRSGLWVGGEFGLALFDGKRFRAVVPRSPLRLETISGIVETPDNELWLNSSNGIVHISAAELRPVLVGKSASVQGETFSAPDGLEGLAPVLRPHPTAVQGIDGKLWFLTNAAVYSVDPKHLIRNSIAPPVVITTLTVGDKVYSPTHSLRLPERSTALRIGYVGLSLTMPEKVRYRYKLDGVNADWQDAAERKEAYFVNINPGTYRFHVIAANNDGVWNDTGASLEFVIPPVFTQTPWFFVVCLVASATLIGLAFRFRVRQLAARMRLRLAERLRERERIARELHDTLLQSTQGLMLHVQAARNRILPEDPARELLDDALKRADEVLAEARDRVQDLRIPLDARADLGRTLNAVGAELALGRAVTFQAVVEGQPRKLRARIVDETYSIGREALLNAFHHAQATSIQLLIVYGTTDLQLQVRDDGCGIDLHIAAEASRAGHWGLKGMRERALEIGAHFELRSSPENGTVVNLSVPAAFANTRHLWSGWRWPFSPRITEG